jgi:hypothetical protein
LAALAPSNIDFEIQNEDLLQEVLLFNTSQNHFDPKIMFGNSWHKIQNRELFTLDDFTEEHVQTYWES